MSKLTQKILDDSIEEVLEEAERCKQTMAAGQPARLPLVKKSPRVRSPNVLKSLIKRAGKV